MAPQIKIANLVEELRSRAQIDHHTDLGTTTVNDVTHDSRAVVDGALFCAVPGSTVDGHDFAAGAVAAGASALLVERFLDVDVPQLRVASVREVMPHAASTVHRHPSRELAVFGVTGTNGKTTTTHILASIARAAGRSTEIIGTLSGLHTTPEGPELQRELRQAADAGVHVVAAEISSHALDQHRVDGTDFAIAAFSNLTPDHLDYHDTMERYFEAKRRLFDGRARHELINVDDDWGLRLANERPDAVRLSNDMIEVLEASIDGTRVRWRGTEMVVPIPGAMNISNALMAAESARLLGIDDGTIAAAMQGVGSVPGRMETVRPADAQDTGHPAVVVDYSHTPDSLQRALATIRSVHPDGKVTVVFGCGGDRDRAKRPMMGQIAEQDADYVYVTSDNPRSEDPQAIIDEILAGMSHGHSAFSIVDRRVAIADAIASASHNDVVLIAGKGHETTQTIGAQVLPFDDAAIAREVLREVRT